MMKWRGSSQGVTPCFKLNDWVQKRTVMKTTKLLASCMSDGDTVISEEDDENSALEHVVAPLRRDELQLGEMLGQGSFARVYEVTALDIKDFLCLNCSSRESDARQRLKSATEESRHMGLEDRMYAVKHLKKELLRRPKLFYEAACALNNEAHLMARLDHPNILKLRGVPLGGVSAFAQTGTFDSFFIMTDRLSETLEERIQGWKGSTTHRNMPSATKIITKSRYALALASALDYLHDRRFIYRDLKPQNVGFARDDTPMLFDFGLCRSLPPSIEHVSTEDLDLQDDMVYRMSLAGTTRYMVSTRSLDSGNEPTTRSVVKANHKRFLS
jgi:serine/threonine protein kinase